MMDEQDRAALDAIRKLYSQSSSTVRPAALVRHSPLTGRAHVDLPPVMAGGLAALGHDPTTYAENYEANLRRQGRWPADLPPTMRLVRRFKRWSRRGWRVVIGGRR